MKSSLNSEKKSINRIGKKIVVFLLVFVMFFSFLTIPSHPAQAQLATFDSISAAWQANTNIWTKMKNVSTYLWQKGGSVAFQNVLRSALNKIAYDTANYIGSGGKGQQPLFVTQNWGDYISQIGDEAAGQFIENFAGNLAANKKADTACQNAYQNCNKPCNGLMYGTPCTDGSVCTLVLTGGICQNGTSCTLPSDSDISAGTACTTNCREAYNTCAHNTGTSTPIDASSDYINAPSFNICQPSSLEAKVKISLGLVEQQRPGAPNCTASAMVNNWGAGAQSMYDDVFKNPNFMQDTAKGIFDPNSNDLGIYYSAQSDLIAGVTAKKTIDTTQLGANKGWLNATNIAGRLLGTPDLAATRAKQAADAQSYNLGRITGDVVVDAANVFLNQIAISSFNNLMSNLGQTASKNASDPTNKNSDPGSANYGQGSLQEVTSTLIKPNFGVRADYDILSSLVMCPDKTNPSPTNCVIDDKFMQGITENKTVADAIKDGFLHSDWQLTQDTRENSYSLRNIQILIKYRILPVGWQEAVNKAYADPNNLKKVTLMDMLSCFDPADSYNQFSSDFDQRDQTWCRGLIDPNWVLKAPLNNCLKLGSGGQIVNKTINPSIASYNGNAYTPSYLNVTRAEDYCADEQTCIKEKANGSCDVYGYCNEERRTWNFSSDSCEPVYNTCQSFTNPVNGTSVSYLENTLNYSGCSADSAGCRQYSTYGNYASSTGTVTWDGNQSVYFNKNLKSCNSKDEACTELLRVKSTWGANLVMDTAYSNEEIGASSTGAALLGDWSYWSSTNTNNATRVATIVDAAQEPGGANDKALKLEVSPAAGNMDKITVGTYSNSSNSLLPDNFQIIVGNSYTVSADVYLALGDNAHIYMGDVADGYVQSTGVINTWTHLTVTRAASNSYSEPVFGINADGASGGVKVYIKNLKFELSDFETTYSAYGAKKTYEKLLPPYLESTCYNDAASATKDYSLKSNAPAICSNYARKCNRTEVGCEQYTNTGNGLAITAQVTSEDYCPQECLGYNVYISKENNFNSPSAQNIIPSTAKICGAESAGCSEFTNLDAVTQGGEQKEYYTALKQCIKPSQTMCGSFYSWEGTDSGYQLRSYSLQKDVNGNPAVTKADNALCNAAVYSAALNDPIYNPDCREFYNSTGQISYHLISKTITCSDNCHAYRLSGKNIDQTLTKAQCDANPTTSHWDANNNVCNVCLGGGLWDSKTSACIYQAIPGEGQTCSAAENNCREYNGSDGSNMRMISSYNFEAGAGNWNSNCSSGLKLTTIANNKDGHSLLYKSSANNCLPIGLTQNGSVAKAPIIAQVIASDNVAAQVSVGNQVTEGKAYSLRFLAKADTDSSLKIYFYNNNQANPQISEFATSTLVVKGGGEWNIYQTNLENLNHAVTPEEVLVISGDNDFYFDDVVLTEITDRYYLIKGSSVVPDICYYDTNDKYQGADYNLGCTQYKDRNNLANNLHKFSKLCSDSSVGCEQMIATQNYTPSGVGIWNDTNKNGVCDTSEPDCTKVEADKAIYAVYDVNKLCNSADKGCSRVGQGTAGTNAWSDVYKTIDPNLYDSILCGQGEVGCEEWKASDGTLNYFRNPGNETCEYRDAHNAISGGKAWYKIAVKRCDANKNGKIDGQEGAGQVCTADSNCVVGSCINDTNDYPCSTSYFKTFGLGGAGNQIAVPDKQAGLCEVNSSGCTEYIDPVSQFSPNLIYNPNFEISSASGVVEGWDNGEQDIKIEQNKLYILSTKDNTGALATTLTFPSGVRELLSDNTLGTTTNTIIIPAHTNQSRVIASLTNSTVTIAGGEAKKTIELKVANVNYQLQANVDKNSCNGILNFDNGCVLFNERSIDGGSGYANLSNKFSAAASPDKQSPVNCNSSIVGSCTANQLIKVTPSRVCAKWLDCLTYVQDPVTNERTCYAVGQCTRLDDKNECANFEDVSTSTAKFNVDLNKNASGYFLLDQYHLSNMKEVGLNSDAHFDFEDNAPALSCKRVDGGECMFNKNIATDLLVREPEKAPIDYPAHGASYLRVPSAFFVSPQSANNWVSVLKKKDYYINFLVDTKNSGMGGRVIISGKTGGDLIVKDFISNSGWSRQIFSFNTGDQTEIKIYLGTTDVKSDRAVYFDDINIEPVLETSQDTSGVKSYVARECRLYPTNDSQTCVNKNNNVLKDGWEGYCLEHDSSNPGVCLMWYPVDSISSTKLNKTSSGYQGKFPLNYCTEVNGNFDLVEKRVGAKIYDGPERSDGSSGWDTGCVASTDSQRCASCPGGSCKDYYVIGLDDNKYVKGACIPKESLLLPNTTVQRNLSDIGLNCPSNLQNTYMDGWAKYDGFGTSTCLDAPCATFDKNNTKQDLIQAGNIVQNEAINSDTPVRVYDYNHPASSEDTLKLISGSDPSQNFRLTCNNFIQTVDYNGDNMAWAARVGISSAWATSTPPYFVDQSPMGADIFYGVTGGSAHNLAAYGRNRQDTPFGAAVWPDSFNLFNSEAVKLRDQFSVKNNEAVLAGRPYGCSNYKLGNSNYNESGTGCSNIGFCSLDPNVYCLLGSDSTGLKPDFVAQKTCAEGGFGTCVPLWSNYLGAQDNNRAALDYQAILKTLFLKSYNSYIFEGGTYAPGKLELSQIPTTVCSPRPQASYDSASISSDSFCYVKPIIGNKELRFNNQTVVGNTTTLVPKKGIYGLQFTTYVDPEQQPLKEIYINWGDGSEQVINGQDNHPSNNNPHVFYHYYKRTDVKTITVKITDNWGETTTLQ